MNAIQYICFRLDIAIEMLLNGKESKDEVACYLMDFKKQLFKAEDDIVEKEKIKLFP